MKIGIIILFGVFSIFAICSCPVWAVNGDMGGASQNGSEANPYLIEDIDDFDEFASNSAYWDSGIHTKLMTDIDLSGKTYTTAVIAPDVPDTTNWGFDGIVFEGIFNGNGFTISNLEIIQFTNEYIGLFGYTSTNSQINNLKLTNMYLEGNQYVGGVVGFNLGSISNCSTEVYIQSDYGYAGGIAGENDGPISHSSSMSTVKGCVDLGGLIGWNNGDITHCSTDGLVQINIDNGGAIGGLVGNHSEGSISNSFSNSSVYGSTQNDSAGGLVGRSGGVIQGCYATGNVYDSSYSTGGLVGYNESNSEIHDSYANGDVFGKYDVGGLVGYNSQSSSGEITNSFATGNVNGEECIGGLIGSCGRGTIINCYSEGNAEGTEYIGGLCGLSGSGSEFNNCFSVGKASGRSNVGGFSGYNFNGVITNCFWDKETSGMTTGYNLAPAYPGTITNVLGKTTTELMTQSTFSVWDFTSDWMMLREGEDYPRLAWQEIFTGDIAGLYGVNNIDFALLASQWGQSVCNESNNWCQGADIDHLDGVDVKDLLQIAEDWMKGL